MAEFLRKVRSEAGVLVSNHFPRGTIVWKNVLDIEVGDGGCGGRFVTGDEDGGF